MVGCNGKVRQCSAYVVFKFRQRVDPASFLLSVSNVHMQIGHDLKDIRPKWYQDFTERFSNSFRGFQVTLSLKWFQLCILFQN